MRDGETVAVWAPPLRRRRGVRVRQIALQVFLGGAALLWLVPVAWTLYTALRPFEETFARGYVSLPNSITGANFIASWGETQMSQHFMNSLIVTLPAVAAILFLASLAAFALSRYSFVLNGTLLIIFTFGNLLPPQVLVTPLFRLFLAIPLPEMMSDSQSLFDSYWGLIAIHTAFQLGFGVFVLANFMRALPVELSEAARVDGAGALRQWAFIIMPLCRVPLAALATLFFTWIYNDFFWGIILIQTGDKMPVTSALALLKGQYFVNNNLIAAGALLVALPALLVYTALQRQFIGGLTLGARKF